MTTPKVADRVLETSTTTGTGNFTLAGAVAGYQAWATAFPGASALAVLYCITDGVNWEVGIGAFTAPSTIARTTVTASSNAGAAVSFPAGTKQVWNDLSAAQLGSMFPFANAAQVWVEVGGNDATGQVGNRNLPFATINAALDALPSTGGDVFLGYGTFAPFASDVVPGGSSLNPSTKMRSYLRFIGSGMPDLDSDTAPTMLVGTSGSVIQGPIYIHSTRNGVEFHNGGTDSGSAVCTALYSGATNIDATVWGNIGQVDSLAPARNPVLQNWRCLAASPTVPVHALCLENVLRPKIDGLDLVYGTHGLAYKGVDGCGSNITSRGHSSECFIFKESNTNNNTAPCHDNVFTNLVCDQVGANDTPTAISLQTASTRPMQRLSITNVISRNMTTNEVNSLTTCTSGTPGLVQYVTINGLQTDHGTIRTSLASYDPATVLINQGAMGTTFGGGGVPTVVVYGDGTGDFTKTGSSFTAIATAFKASIGAKIGDIVEAETNGLAYVAGGAALQLNYTWGSNAEPSTTYAYCGNTSASQQSFKRLRTLVTGDVTAGVLTVIPMWSAGSAGTAHLANNQDVAFFKLTNYGNGTGFGGRLGGAIATVTGTYTMSSTDYTILADTTGSSFTVNLCATPIEGQLANVKKTVAGNTLTIGHNGNNINGAASDLVITSIGNTRLQYDTTAGWNTL